MKFEGMRAPHEEKVPEPLEESVSSEIEAIQAVATEMQSRVESLPEPPGSTPDTLEGEEAQQLKAAIAQVLNAQGD